MFSTLKWLLSSHTVISIVVMCLIGGPSAVASVRSPCPSGEVICPVERIWTERELAEHTTLPQPTGYAFFVDEAGLTFVYHRLTKSVDPVLFYTIGIDMPMEHVERTDYWTVTLWFEGIHEAILGVGLGDGSKFTYPFAVYRGINAPAAPMVNSPLIGSLKTIPFKSESLNQTRMLTIYLPPQHDPTQTYPVIYMADGQDLESYAGSLDHLITEGIVPPLIVVGMWSADGQRRGQEYVIGRNAARFEKHARFFTQEVREWAERQLGASAERAQRGLFGFSNGALLAIVMTVQHPDLYGFAFPFSAGANAGYEDSFRVDSTTVKLPLHIYGTAGTLEPLFLETTKRYLRDYKNAGAEVVFSQNVAGHDGALWELEFVKAVRWMFENQDTTD